MQSNPIRKTKRERVMELLKNREIHCSLCPLHRGENSVGRRKRTDRHKNKR